MKKTDPAKVMEDYRIYVRWRSETWEKPAKKGYRYYFGDHWSPEDKDILRAAFRADSVFNNVLPVVDLVVGHQLQGRVDLVAKPADRFADVEIADIITSVIKSLENMNNMSLERRFQFLDGLLTGIGICEKWFDTDEEIEGEIKVRQLSPFHFYLDPDFEKYDYSDAKKLFKETWMTTEDIERIYGKKIARKLPLLEGYKYSEAVSPVRHEGDSFRDYGNQAGSTYDETEREGVDRNKGKYRVIEQYEMMWEDVDYYYDAQNQKLINLDDLEDMERELVKDLAFTRKQSHIHLTTIIAEDIIAEDKSLGAHKWNELFSFYFAYFLNGKIWGIVENLISPQDEINKRHSTMIHILSTHDNSGIWYEEGAFPEEVEANLTEDLAINGMATKVTEGAIRENKIKEKVVKDVPATLRWIIQSEPETMKYISGATDNIQGLSQRQESGRAKEAGIAQAATRLAGIIENFRETQRLDGKGYLYWIQNKYTGERVFRIIGNEYGASLEEVYINHPAFGMIFNDVTIGKYDVSLEFETRTASERERIKWLLVELSNTVPAYADIIAEYVLLYSDIPQKEKIYQEFKQRQMQMQQMQQIQAMGGAPGGQPPGMPSQPRIQPQMGGGGRGPVQSAPRPSRAPRRQPAVMRGV